MITAAFRQNFSSHGSPPFPLSLSPGLWIDASDATTLYDATSGGSLVAADGLIARWQDKSGNGRHFTQADSAYRPQRKTSYQNGLDAVLSNHKYMLISGGSSLLNNVSGATIIAAYKWIASPTTQSYVLMHSNNAGLNRCSIGGGSTSGKANQYGRRLDSDGGVTITGTSTLSISSFMIQTALVDYAGAKAYLYVNGILETTQNPFQTAGNTSATNSSIVGLGGIDTGTVSNIAEVEFLVFPRLLNSTDRGAVESYLREKWATP